VEVVGSVGSRQTVRSVAWPRITPSEEALEVSKDEESRLGDLSDEELMQRFAREDHRAFELLLDRYRQPLFGFLFRYLGRHDKAEDVFQDVFLEVIRARRRYRFGLKFSAWLFSIARNRAVDRLRRDALREMVPLEDPVVSEGSEGNGPGGSMACAQPDPEHVAMGRELERALDVALEKLPDEQREVLWLKETSGLTLPEVARILRISENTAKSRLRYALEKIRAELTRQGYEP